MQTTGQPDDQDDDVFGLKASVVTGFCLCYAGYRVALYGSGILLSVTGGLVFLFGLLNFWWAWKLLTDEPELAEERDHPQ